MNHAEVLSTLRDYIVREVLEGRGEGLEPDSPLLEWGVLNSMEVVRLTHFIRDTWNIKLSSAQLLPARLQNLNAIATLVIESAPEN